MKKIIGLFLVASPVLTLLTLMAMKKGIMEVLVGTTVISIAIGIIVLGVHLMADEN